jgi:hypothetical protein
MGLGVGKGRVGAFCFLMFTANERLASFRLPSRVSNDEATIEHSFVLCGYATGRRKVLGAMKTFRDHQRTTGPVYRASFSTGGYRGLTPGFYRSRFNCNRLANEMAPIRYCGLTVVPSERIKPQSSINLFVIATAE